MYIDTNNARSLRVPDIEVLMGKNTTRAGKLPETFIATAESLDHPCSLSLDPKSPDTFTWSKPILSGHPPPQHLIPQGKAQGGDDFIRLDRSRPRNTWSNFACRVQPASRYKQALHPGRPSGPSIQERKSCPTITWIRDD